MFRQAKTISSLFWAKIGSRMVGDNQELVDNVSIIDKVYPHEDNYPQLLTNPSILYKIESIHSQVFHNSFKIKNF